MMALAGGLSAPVAAAPPQRGDFRALVPADWKLQPPDSNWHSYRFVSPARDAWLALYAKPADGESPGQHMKWLKAIPGERTTYERRGAGWIVVSGFRGDRIFYRKAMLACGNRRWHHLAFEYPAGQKAAFDHFVTQASHSLRAYRRTGCGSEAGAAALRAPGG